MKTYSATRAGFLWCGFVLLVAGCGGSTGLIPTEGVLTLDGEPVEGAAIAFVSEGEGGSASQAMTDAEGAFKLYTANLAGIKAGTYRVTVFKLGGGGAKTAGPPKSALPEIYASKDTTPITVEIPHGEELRIELESQ